MSVHGDRREVERRVREARRRHRIGPGRHVALVEPGQYEIVRDDWHRQRAKTHR